LLQTEYRVRSVGLSVTTVSPAKAAELIEILFGMWTRVGPRNHVLNAVQIPTRGRAILRAKIGRPRTEPVYAADADWGVLNRR